MEKVIEDSINEVSEKIYKTLDNNSKLRKIIKRDVYVKPKNAYYAYGKKQPTYEFLDAWDWLPAKKDMGKITKELFYNWQKLSVDEENWVHGSFDGDARENLADILNLAFNNYKAGFTSDYRWPPKANNPKDPKAPHFSKFRQPFWENFVKNLFDEGELDRMFISAFRKRGIKIKKI